MDESPGNQTPLVWLAIPVLILGLVLTSITSQQLGRHHHQYAGAIYHTLHNAQATALAAGLQGRLAALQQLASNPASEDSDFELQVRALKAAYPDLLVVTLLGAYTPEALTLAPKALAAIQEDSHWQRVLNQALETGQPAATTVTPVRIANQDQRRVTGVFIPGPNDHLLLALIDLPALFSSAHELIGDTLRLAVYDSSQHARTPFFYTHAGSQALDETPTAGAASILTFADRQWLLRSALSPSVLPRPPAVLIWLPGLLLSLVAAALIGWLGYQLILQQRAIDHEHTGQAQLKAQLRNLQVEKDVLRQALEESEERSRDLVALAGGFIAELDEQGLIGFISAQVDALAGYAPADLIERNFASLICPDSKIRFEEAMTAARQEKTMTRVDLSLLHAEGMPLPYTLRIKPVIDPLSGCAGFRLSGTPDHSAASNSRGID